MKWTHPQIGDTRQVIKFAWLPTQVYDEHTKRMYVVWLENYLRTDQWDAWFDGEGRYDGWGVVKSELYEPAKLRYTKKA